MLTIVAGVFTLRSRGLNVFTDCSAVKLLYPDPPLENLQLFAKSFIQRLCLYFCFIASMGNSEDTKLIKQEKLSPVKKDQANLHVYPELAAMQVYYGPRLAVPPYFNSPVASGHPPHPCMWGPPQLGISPYAAIYAHGGVHTHPGVPMGSPGHGAVPYPVTSEAMAAIPLTTETPSKSFAHGEHGLMNKLKTFSGLEMSIGNENTQSGEDDHGMSLREVEGSSDGSNENPAGICPKGKKRNREESPTNLREGKMATSRSPVPSEEVDGSCGEAVALPILPTNVAVEVGATPKITTVVKVENASGLNVKPMASNAPQSCAVLPREACLQNERELKRERRKQSNRESARRSRLRRQAEAEGLGKKVLALSAENMTLISEINALKGNSEQLRLENAKLMEKLQEVKLEESGAVSVYKSEEVRVHPIRTADLLGRVNNSGSVDRNNDEDGVFENKRHVAKLRQLLDAGPRADAVAAG